MTFVLIAILVLYFAYTINEKCDKILKKINISSSTENNVEIYKYVETLKKYVGSICKIEMFLDTITGKIISCNDTTVEIEQKNGNIRILSNEKITEVTILNNNR